jgi:hypothetical protein
MDSISEGTPKLSKKWMSRKKTGTSKWQKTYHIGVILRLILKNLMKRKFWWSGPSKELGLCWTSVVASEPSSALQTGHLSAAWLNTWRFDG